MAKSKEVKQSFQELAADLDKKFSGNTDIQHFDLSTGSLSLDLALGGGIRSGRITELIAWEGGGKAQPLSSKILTPFGWIKMQKAEIGTIVSTPDGKDSTICI